MLERICWIFLKVTRHFAAAGDELDYSWDLITRVLKGWSGEKTRQHYSIINPGSGDLWKPTISSKRRKEMGAMKIGFIGLGKMGYRMANKLLREKHELVVWNRSPGPAEELLADYRSRPSPKNSGLLSITGNVTELVRQLDHPRVVWTMLPAGGPTEAMIKTLSDLVKPEDILIDGGNSYFKDTEKRFNDLQCKIKFLGIGVSGGIVAENRVIPDGWQ
jgi:lactate dehydrogenase-like 2-hydroxyacid dehydrogenase